MEKINLKIVLIIAVLTIIINFGMHSYIIEQDKNVREQTIKFVYEYCELPQQQQYMDFMNISYNLTQNNNSLVFIK